MKTRNPVAVSSPKARPMPSPSMKLWTESPSGAENPDVVVRAGLRRFVAVMQDQRALGEEESEEADAHAGRPFGVADVVDRLRQHVEQRDRDDDPARQRDHGRQVVRAAKRSASDEVASTVEAGEPGSRSSCIRGPVRGSPGSTSPRTAAGVRRTRSRRDAPRAGAEDSTRQPGTAAKARQRSHRFEP